MMVALKGPDILWYRKLLLQMASVFVKQQKNSLFSFNSAELKCKAIHFPKPARSGFYNMGWALLLYLPCCIFKAAILNLYIFFHCHAMRLTDKAVVNSLRIKIGTVPWTRYVSDHPVTCFFLTSPITTNYLALGYVFAPLDSEGKESSRWIKLENNCLTCMTTDLLFDGKCVCGQWNGNKSSTCWVFCGNKQRNVECFNTCQSKQRNF